MSMFDRPPLSRAFDGPVKHRVHAYTGELIPVERWVSEILTEDLDWFVRQWDAEDEFDWTLRAAGITP